MLQCIQFSIDVMYIVSLSVTTQHKFLVSCQPTLYSMIKIIRLKLLTIIDIKTILINKKVYLINYLCNLEILTHNFFFRSITGPLKAFYPDRIYRIEGNFGKTQKLLVKKITGPFYKAVLFI